MRSGALQPDACFSTIGRTRKLQNTLQGSQLGNDCSDPVHLLASRGRVGPRVEPTRPFVDFPLPVKKKSKKGGGLLPMAPKRLLIQLLTSIKLSSFGTVQLPLCCFFILVQWTWRRAPRRREGNTHGVREFRTRVDIKFIWRASHWTPQPHGSSTRDTEAILVVTSDDQSELSPVFMSTKRQLVSGVQRRAWHDWDDSVLVYSVRSTEYSEMVLATSTGTPDLMSSLPLTRPL